MRPRVTAAVIAAALLLPGAARAEGETGVRWFKGSLEQALARAKAEKKIVFFDAWARWCGPCHVMDKEVWSRDDVARALEHEAIPIKLEVDRAGGVGLAVGNRYAIQALPNMLFLAPDGSILERLEGTQPADLILKTLDRASAAAGGAALVEAAGNDPAALVRAGARLARAGKDAEARAALERALAADADCSKDEADDAALLLADLARRANDPAAEAAALERGVAPCTSASGVRELWDRLLALAAKDGDSAHSIPLLKRRAERFPDDAEALRALAAALATTGTELELAERSATRAMTLAPDDPGPMAALAAVRLAQKRPADARDLIDRAIKIDPHDPELREFRLKVQRALP